MREVAFALVMMFGVFVQSTAGFGGPLIAMPLGIVLMGLPVAKPVTTVLAWLAAMTVVFKQYKYINFRELIKMVAVMLAGVLVALWFSDKIQLNFMLVIYAVIVTLIGIKQLFFNKKKESPAWVQNTALALAGVMQGFFVSGGSFLAVYSVARLPEKQEFRATVSAVWSVIDTVMIIIYFCNGALTGEALKMSGILIIPTIATAFFGEFIAKHIKQSTFLKAVFIILIISGIVLFVTNI